MSRRGITMAGEFLVGLMLGLFIFGVAIYIISGGFKGTTDNLDNFRSCEGVMGSLGGHEGKCVATDDCSDAHADGYYFQRIGKGSAAGCPDTAAQYCCIAIPESDNPVASDTLASAYCNKISEGSWGYAFVPPNGQKPYCTPLPADGVLSIPRSDSKLLLFYKPKDSVDTSCQVRGNNKVATYVQETNGRYVAHPTTTCWQAKDDDGKITFYLGTRNEMTNYFASSSTVLLQLDLKLVPQGTAKNLKLSWVS